MSNIIYCRAKTCYIVFTPKDPERVIPKLERREMREDREGVNSFFVGYKLER